jgi:hypothetical protein
MEIIAPSVPNRPRVCLVALAVFALCSCATRPQFSRTAPGAYLELDSSPAVATVHFPRGTYVLESSDSTGFYYRAPRSLVKHSFAGPQPYDGGVFVTRRQPPRVRGYIIWAAGLTKIGDLTRQPHTFHD